MLAVLIRVSSGAGNAPTLMSVKHLKKVAPMWMNVSKAIFDDEEAHEVRCCTLC